MHILDRFLPPDIGFRQNIKALCFKPAQKTDAVKSAPESEISPDDLIADLCDQIGNVAFDCGLSASIRITYTATCRSCQNDYEIDIDNVNDFDPLMSYCGGSEHCLP